MRRGQRAAQAHSGAPGERALGRADSPAPRPGFVGVAVFQSLGCGPEISVDYKRFRGGILATHSTGECIGNRFE
ncbi:MAG TPA: hypothetical protein VMH39_13440, partial [Gemmatimonadaceae bacterium]|nr:hypothetical protein [Gemmatimonadaceae bacterium]